MGSSQSPLDARGSVTATPSGSACLKPAEIERLLGAELSDEEIIRLSSHLDLCDICRKQVLSPSDSSIAEIDLKLIGERRRGPGLELASVSIARLNDLLSDYQIVREIGRGGMGVVYEAKQLKLNRIVALKILPALLGAVNPTTLMRFRREAELAARLKHTNIIAVYDYGEVDGMPYYAMELVKGPSLGAMLREAGEPGVMSIILNAGNRSASRSAHGDSATKCEDSSTQDEDTARGSSAHTSRQYYRQIASWIADVADALDFAHEQGITHRDIKPSNLLLNDAGRLMISDFGLASSGDVESLTRTRGIVGTARYMSPEQVDSTVAVTGARSDIYGIGATLYELLAFRPMFPTGSDRDVLAQVLQKQPPSPRRLVRSVPRELETICEKAIEKSPRDRYDRAKAMADDLRRWLLGLPIEARRQGWTTRAIKFIRRRRLAVSATISLVMLTVAGSYFFWNSSRWRANAISAQSQSDAREVEMALVASGNDFRDGHFEKALARVEAALLRHPNVPSLHTARALDLNRLGRTSEAIEDLESFLLKHPQSAEVHRVLAGIYNAIGDRQNADRHAILFQKHASPNEKPNSILAIRALAEPDPEKRILVLTEAIEKEPEAATNLLARSMAYCQLVKYKEMLADAQQAVALRPNWAQCHTLLGKAQFNLKRYGDALASFSRAIELDPNSADSWVGRALAQTDAGKLDAALFDANRAIEIDPDCPRAFSCRGVIKARLGDPTAGLQDCARAIELEPKLLDHYMDRMWVYKHLGEWDKIEADASRMIELAPNKYLGYNWRAIALLGRAAHENAIADLNRALELYPANDECLYLRALCRVRMSEFKLAVADLNHCLEVSPAYSPAYEVRSRVLWKLGMHVEALADVTRWIDLGKAPFDAYSRRARMSMRLGLYKDAIRDHSRVLEKSPYDEIALLGRGMNYELIGEFERAIEDYKRVASGTGAAREYGILWHYFALKANRRGDEADHTLDVAHENRQPGQADRWIDHLFRFVRGNESMESLLAAAANDNERAEAYYYVGRISLLRNALEDALVAFERCSSFNQDDLLEADHAVAISKRLSAAKPDELQRKGE